MKNLKYTFLLLFAFMLSCTDLDLSPADAFTEDVIFQDLEAYKSYLAKVYAAYSLTGQDGPNGDGDISIVNDEGFTSYIRAYWKAQQLTTEETVVGWTDAGIRDLHEHSWSSENQFVRVIYYRIALIVSIANDFLKQASEDAMTANGIADADKEIIRGYVLEARFLRAMAFWHALDLFRNVPLETSITATPPVQADPTELYNFIKDELIDIETQLPAPKQNQYGRVDQAGVWMLQAKMYLNAESMVGLDQYTECIEACQKVMNAGYSLDEDYETLFMKDNHESNEIIFALTADGKNSQSWGCTTFLVHAAIGGSMVDADSGVDGGWAGIRATSGMIEKFPDTTGDIDNRAIFYTDGQNLEINDIGQFTDGIAVPKWKNLNQDGISGSDPTHADTDYGMFRLADAYFMYAESVLRGGAGGDAGTALDLLNEVRNRAYNNSDGTISAADMTLDFILDERSREFYWEGTRRLDLVRFGQFTDQGIWPWKGGVKEGRLTESFRNIFPIPASDLLANPELVQNPGY